jgi:hypothetical protein
MNSMPNRIWFLLLSLLTLINCDTDRFLGYNYEAESLVESAPISGRVTNIFTSAPVTSATIKIGSYETLTDINGGYLLVYSLGTDEERDRPIPVTVSAPNYFSKSLETIIYPQALELNFSLEYAAPIIESAVITPRDILTVNCDATVFDYQGVDDIDSVIAVFTYFDSLKARTEIPVDMTRLQILSQNRAAYQCTARYVNRLYGDLNTKGFQIIAKDKSGFVDIDNIIITP